MFELVALALFTKEVVPQDRRDHHHQLRVLHHHHQLLQCYPLGQRGAAAPPLAEIVTPELTTKLFAFKYGTTGACTSYNMSIIVRLNPP